MVLQHSNLSGLRFDHPRLGTLDDCLGLLPPHC